MKKLIAILVLLAVCLGGCATAQRPEQTELTELTEAPETETAEEVKVTKTNDVTELFEQGYAGDYELI